MINFGTKDFYKTFLMIALPMALQNMITTSVNLIDNIMIGQLGDVLYCLISDVAALWLVGVLGAYLSGLVFGLPIIPVYIISQAEEIVKFILIGVRVIKRNWIKDLVNK